MTPSRRNFLSLSASLPALSILPSSAGAEAGACEPSASQALAASISESLFAGDGLARPARATPAVSDLATGLDRTMVLGGGGEYYVAWYCGFFHGLIELGLDPSIAEMVVGTSAGSYVGSALLSGHFQRLRVEFDFFGRFPALFARLAPVATANASQKRAQEINFRVKDGSPDSIRAIGHAALAADNRLNGSGVERLAWLLTGDSRTDWPVAKMFITANDCYTGERLVVGQAAAEKRNSVGSCCGGEFVPAGRHRADPARAALLHGRRHLADMGPYRCRRRVEKGSRDNPDQWI